MPLHTAAAAAVMRTPSSTDAAAGAVHIEAERAMLPAEEAYWEMKLHGEAARLNIDHQLTPDLLGLFHRLVHHTAAVQCAKVQPAIDMLNARLDRIDIHHSSAHNLRELHARMEKLVESMVRLRSGMALAQNQGRLLGQRNEQLLRENTRLKTENMQLLQRLQLMEATLHLPASTQQQQQHWLAPAGATIRVPAESSSPFAVEAHIVDPEAAGDNVTYPA